MKDFLENLQDAAERRLIEQTKDCPFGYFKCGCGNVEKIEDAQPYSESPFSLLICQNCWLEWAKKKGIE